MHPRRQAEFDHRRLEQLLALVVEDAMTAELPGAYAAGEVLTLAGAANTSNKYFLSKLYPYPLSSSLIAGAVEWEKRCLCLA